MKLLHVNNVFHPLGGSEVYLYSLCRELGKLGITSSIVHGSAYEHHDSELVKSVYHVDMLDEFGRQSKKRLKSALHSIIGKEQQDFICLHNIHNPHVIEILTDLGTVIKFVHDHELYCPRNNRILRGEICLNNNHLNCVLNSLIGSKGAGCIGPRSRPLELLRRTEAMFRNDSVHKKVEKFIVASRHMKNTMVSFGYNPASITVNPYFTHIPAKPLASSNRKNILFVGRLCPEKGLDCLLDCLGLLEEDFSLTVVGEGKPEYMAALQEKVQGRGLPERVEFRGWVDHVELAKFYREAAVVAVTSIWPEPFGLIGIEAMARSRPVVAFDVGGISEWLADKETGFLVKRGDIVALAEKIDLLLHDVTLRQKMGISGYERAKQFFNRKRHVEKLMRVLGSHDQE